MKAEFKSPHTVIDKFTSLLDISRRINSEKNFDELLKIIAAEAAKLVDAERATIFLLNKEKGELWAKIAIGPTGPTSSCSVSPVGGLGHFPSSSSSRTLRVANGSALS